MAQQEPSEAAGGLYNVAALREQYGEWLSSLDWHTFGTFTFRHGRSVRRAGELFRAFLDGGATASHGEHFALSVACWGSEPHKSGDGHVHALLRWHPWVGLRAEAFSMSAAWRLRFGRVELSPYDPTRGAAYYLTKYVLKDAAGSGEWDVWKEGGTHADNVGGGELLRPPGRGREEGAPWKSRQEVEEEIDEGWWLEEVLREIEGQAARA